MKKIVILILFICFSCTNKQQDLEYFICKDSIQYWNYEWPRDRAEFYGFTFSFDNKGNVVKYSYSKTKNKRWVFWDTQDTNINKWSVTKDSIFTNMGAPKKIIKCTEDTIYAIDIKTKEQVKYIRVRGKLNIQEPISVMP